MEVKIKRLASCFESAPIIPIPEYKTDGSSGFDLESTVKKVIRAGKYGTVPTGLCVAIPEGFELQVRPRSGLALKQGISVVNSPGTVDSDYRGELVVILINHDLNNDFEINRGDRIAQAVVAPIVRVNFVEVQELDSTIRGEKGFGSTGV